MAAMATVTSSTLTYLIHYLLRHPKPTSPVCLFLRPFSVSVLTCKSNHGHHGERRFPSISSSLPLPRPYISLSHSFSSLLVPRSFSSAGVSEQDEDNVSLASLSEINDEEEDGSDRTVVSMMTESSALKLSVKEKKKIASFAHSLGDKLKCQLVGKSGITDSVILSFIETLDKNELLKVKIHRTCPGELKDLILHLEEATGSVSVGQIARTLILYRPTPTKLKAEEKKTKK